MRKRILFLLLLAVPFLYSCKEKVTSIVIVNGHTVNLYVGETDTLEYIVYPLSMEGSADVTWQSSDESIVTVSDGIITALKAGTADVYATCDGMEAQCVVNVSDVKVNETFHTAILYFMGDRYGIGTNNFILRLLGDGLTHDGAGGIEGSGLFMNICFNLNATDTAILTGDYKCDTTGVLRTFYPGRQSTYYYPGTYYGLLTSSGTQGYLMEDGSFKVSGDEDAYTISLAFTGSGLDINGSFTGPIVEFDASGSYTEKELTFTSASAITLTGETEYKSVLLTLQGDESLQLQVNIPMSATTIPGGSYMVSNAGGEFTLTMGSQEDADYDGSWYMGDPKTPITNGSMTVELSGSAYTITCSLYAGDYHLTGTYIGAISIE